MKEARVNVWIYDADLRVRKQGKYPLSSDGTRIKIVSGGDGHFMPALDKGSYIEVPKKRWFPPFTVSYEKLYIVKNRASQPVNFETEQSFGLNEEDIKNAARAEIIRNFGKYEQKTPTIWYIILLVMLAVAAKVFGVIV